ncbi:hypothetical protein [Clostridioides sp. ES-S-0001-03]|uniref:hypothetical protein n=1 Tax=Clostridioides sp. ES-S-0001-03 TaxID=2770771 RepID=UPI001D0BF948|nr:hypothetical protein [Clostridioides sp. ES-S-0001-03]
MNVVKGCNKQFYVILNSACLQDSSLSWQAKGLHLYLMTKSENEKIYLEDLKNKSSNGRDSTANILNELIEKGYVSREIRRDTLTGKVLGGYEYKIYEESFENIEK